MEDAIRTLKKEIYNIKFEISDCKRLLRMRNTYRKQYIINRLELNEKSLYQHNKAIQILELNSLYPVLEDAKRSEADSTHGEASNH